jgi:transcriptional regulator with XRE-family HTH domain
MYGRIMTIGQRIRRIRREKGMQQKAVAKRAGIDPNSLSRIERDVRQPTAGTVARLAQALGVAPGELFADAEEVASPKALSLSSLSLRRWLRERGFRYALMSTTEFAEHVLDQDPEVDETTGIPVLVQRIFVDFDKEESEIKQALRKENARRDSALTEMLPEENVHRRAGAIDRFINRELKDHYSDLHAVLIRFTHELAARRAEEGKIWDVLAPSPGVARRWREEAMDAALKRVRSEASSSSAAHAEA